MDGKLYYTFKAPKEDVRFFALESTYMDPDQMKWIEDELKKSGEKWKIVRTSTTRSTRRRGTPRLAAEAARRCSSRCSSSTTSAWCSTATTTSTSASSRRTGSYFVEGSSGQLRQRGHRRKARR